MTTDYYRPFTAPLEDDDKTESQQVRIFMLAGKGCLSVSFIVCENDKTLSVEGHTNNNFFLEIKWSWSHFTKSK